MRFINFQGLTWLLFRNLSPWEIHERKKLLRKVVLALVLVIYIVGGIVIYLYETNKLKFFNSERQDELVKENSVDQKNVALITVRDTLFKNDSMLNPAFPKTIDSTVVDDRFISNVAGDSSISVLHGEMVGLKSDSLFVASDKCHIIPEKPKPKSIQESQEYWYSPLVDLAYADKIRNYYSGCVVDHLEQPYASVALAVSAILAYQDEGQNGFNFLGGKVWKDKKFENASDYFKEFAVIFNPGEIEDEYFDKYQGKRVPLSEQYWRAYVEKYFPDVHPQTVKQVMQRWGYRYTEIE